MRNMGLLVHTFNRSTQAEPEASLVYIVELQASQGYIVILSLSNAVTL